MVQPYRFTAHLTIQAQPGEAPFHAMAIDLTGLSAAEFADRVAQTIFYLEEQAARFTQQPAEGGEKPASQAGSVARDYAMMKLLAGQ